MQYAWEAIESIDSLASRSVFFFCLLEHRARKNNAFEVITSYDRKKSVFTNEGKRGKHIAALHIALREMPLFKLLSIF